MTRSEITKFLSRLLEKSRFSGPGKYWAREVSLDYGYAAGKPRRVDMDYRDKKPRYKGICPVCGKTNWICKSIAMELGVNTGIGHCLGCNTFLNVKFNEERQEMDLEIYEDYVKRTSEKEE